MRSKKAAAARLALSALAMALVWALPAAPAAEAKGISFYCVLTGTAPDGRQRYVFGPTTRFQPEACDLARTRCRVQRLGNCRYYGLFRKA